MGKKTQRKKIKREREGKDPSRIPKFIKEKHSWSDLTAKQKKAVKRIRQEPLYLRHFAFLKVTMDVQAVAERYCKAYVKEDWKKTGHLSDLPKNGYATQDEYTTYMKKNAVTGVEDYQIKETKENRQIKIESEENKGHLRSNTRRKLKVRTKKPLFCKSKRDKDCCYLQTGRYLRTR